MDVAAPKLKICESQRVTSLESLLEKGADGGEAI